MVFIRYLIDSQELLIIEALNSLVLCSFDFTPTDGAHLAVEHGVAGGARATRGIRHTTTGHINRYLRHYHPWAVALGASDGRLTGLSLLHANLLLALLVLQDLLLVLLEAHKVKVQIFDAILF